MTVSTSVIVAITVLACCLIITSALLVYKLRPDVQQISAKWSGYVSEPPSPVRKMTVVRGVVVEDDIKRPSRAFLPRWSTLYTSRRSSTASSLGSRISLILDSQIDLEAQLSHANEKFPRVNVHEYLGFEKSRRARKTKQHRTQSMNIPPPITLHQDSSSTDDELRVSPGAFSPKTIPLSAPAALSREASSKDTSGVLSVVKNNDSVRRHSTPADILLSKPQTRGKFNVAFLQAASISALPPTAYSARATPEPSIRLSMSETPGADRTQCAVLTSPSEPDEQAKEESIRTSRRPSRDLETIIEATAGSDAAAAPSPIVHLLPRNSRPKSQSSSRPISRRLREGSLLQRLGKNRPSPIRVGAVTDTNEYSIVNGRPVSQRTDGTAQDMAIKDPLTTSAPTTPPVLSAGITNGIPSYPAWVPSAAKNRQSTATISSSQYSPTFSLASAQRVPLFAGTLSPLGANISVPNVAVAGPPSGRTQSIPMSSREAAAGLRKSSHASEVSTFPKTPYSIRNSPISSTFSPQPFATGKRLHGVSPLVNGANTSKPAVNLPQDRPRRPSRYSHLIDKDLPAPPPTSTVVATLLEAHLRPQVQSPTQQSQLPKQKLPLPQPPKSSISESQRISNAKASPIQAVSFQQIPQPFSPPAQTPLRMISPFALSSATQQTNKSIQEPRPPVIPHIRSQSLSSKASSEIQRANVLSTLDASAKNQTCNESALASSPTISPLDLLETKPESRSTSQTVPSTTALSIKPLPTDLQLNLNLDLSGGSELGLDFGRGAFGS